MSFEKIISEWKKGVFKPVYWLEGDENYYIDKVMDYAEHQILSENEAGFNLSVFYGKDSNCRHHELLPSLPDVFRKAGGFTERGTTNAGYRKTGNIC